MIFFVSKNYFYSVYNEDLLYQRSNKISLKKLYELSVIESNALPTELLTDTNVHKIISSKFAAFKNSPPHRPLRMANAALYTYNIYYISRYFCSTISITDYTINRCVSSARHFSNQHRVVKYVGTLSILFELLIIFGTLSFLVYGILSTLVFK